MATSSEGPPSAKRAHLALNTDDCKVCFICKISGGSLVKQPRYDSYEQFVQCVRDRALYGDQKYISINSRLDKTTPEDLNEKKVSWHSACYKLTIHKSNMKRQKDRYEKALSAGNIPPLPRVGRPPGTSITSPSAPNVGTSSRYTRSVANPLNKKHCFFCDGTSSKENLHQISEFKTGNQLRMAVEASDNDRWKVNLSAAIDPSDAHAIDIKYHLSCWVKNVQRSQSKSDTHRTEQENISVVSADIEFYYLINTLLKSGSILDINEVSQAYHDIHEMHGSTSSTISRRSLKRKLEENIEDLEFCHSPRVNEPDRIYRTKTKNAAIDNLAEAEKNAAKDMKVLFKCAKIIRDDIAMSHKQQPWVFEGSLLEEETTVPKLLEAFIRWIIVGPMSSLQSRNREHNVQLLTKTIAQNIMFAHKSDRQVAYVVKHEQSGFRHQHENPQVVGLGLKVHQATRGKTEIDLLHKFGYTISYERILRIETQLANAIMQQTANNNGVYIPNSLVKGRFIYFAIDNVDFAEDTPDGKSTLHATATAVFQPRRTNDPPHKAALDLQHQSSDRSLSNVPTTISQLLPCNIKSQQKPLTSTKYPAFTVKQNEDTLLRYISEDISWLLARSYQRNQHKAGTEAHAEMLPDETEGNPMGRSNIDDTLDAYAESIHHRPESNLQTVAPWSAYNSLCCPKDASLTSVHVLPLLAAPAHEFSTLLTVLKQAEHINAVVVGPDKKTIITFDMALYERAKKLEMLHPECRDRWVLRIGEFHTVLCALRAIGSSMEGSGIDDAWIAADIYGPLTTRQILEGKHMRRSLEAHITTLQVFFDLYIEAFLRDKPDLQQSIREPLQHLADVCANIPTCDVGQKHKELVAVLEQQGIQDKLNKFEESNKDRPMFVMATQYMDMIISLLEFIRATRSGIWLLHLSSLENLCKLFFAQNRLKYAQMVPLYIAEMYALRDSDPEIWEEFSRGHFCVSKSQVPFCSIGVDHAIEHVNRTMKVKGGLSGITQKPAALMRFFLIAPELTRISQEVQQMASITPTCRVKHHEQSRAIIDRQEHNIKKLKSVLADCNPFDQEDSCLKNFVTKAVMPENVQHDILRSTNVGQECYMAFVKERIVGTTNLWDKMSKVKLLGWTDASKSVKVSLETKEIELKQSRSLFARLLIVTRTRPELDLQQLVGEYEFSCLPRSIFSADGWPLPCTDKSKLMALLESLPDKSFDVRESTQEPTDDQQEQDKMDTQQHQEQMDDHQQGTLPSTKAIVMDGMAVVYEMSSQHIKTCTGIAQQFLMSVENKSKGYQVVHIVFDRYDIEQSLKSKTRNRRKGKMTTSCTYEVNDKTQFNMPMKRFLSNSANKDQLTSYLAKKTLGYYKESTRVLIVSTKDGAASNGRNVEHLNSNQEEADTLLILHAIDASHSVGEVHIMSPDTDVFVLALHKLPLLDAKVCMLVGTGSKRRTVHLQPIYNAIGRELADGLIGFHAFTGSDTTGRIARKGKQTCWKFFSKASRTVLQGFVQLGQSTNPSTDVMNALEEYVCSLFAPGLNIKDIGKLRWHLFKKNQAEAEKLPPTKAALKEHILRAHYQALIWSLADTPNPDLPCPKNYGWMEENHQYIPRVSELPPAPGAVVKLVKCGCSKSRCTTASCSCKKNALACTELCACDADTDKCENTYVTHAHSDEVDDDDDDGEEDLLILAN